MNKPLQYKGLFIFKLINSGKIPTGPIESLADANRILATLPDAVQSAKNFVHEKADSEKDPGGNPVKGKEPRVLRIRRELKSRSDVDAAIRKLEEIRAEIEDGTEFWVEVEE